MKQKTTALIIVGIAAIMLFAINCSGSSPSDKPPIPEPEVCECTDKEHEGECPPPCPGKGGENCDCTDPVIIEPEVCECPDGTAHEPEDYPCCESDDCTCVIAEPAVRDFPLNLFENNTSTIQDARTSAGSRTLDDLGITAKIENAINGAFNAANGPSKNRFRNVFNSTSGNKVTIIVEKTSSYEHWAVSNRYMAYLNFDYLVAATDENLQAKIIEMVTHANTLPEPVMAKAYLGMQ